MGRTISNSGLLVHTTFALETGRCIYMKSENIRSKAVLNVMRLLIAQAVKQHEKHLHTILYYDPFLKSDFEVADFRYSGEDKVSHLFVPENKQQLQNELNAILEKAKQNYKKKSEDYYVVLLRGYPDEYESESVDLVRELCFNSKMYHVIVVLAGIKHKDERHDNDAIPFTHDEIAIIQDNPFIFISPFKDALKLNSNITTSQIEYIQQLLCAELEKKVFDNRFDRLFKPDEMPRKPKGTKKPNDLPYAVTETGEILYTSLKTGNYLYGVAGSGKSTMLHTLITSIIATTHPDDMALWLIDFKMVEFKRYIDKCPPHVRAVILDRSPELVYSLIDYLYDRIYTKRREKFAEKGWLSPQEADIYLPAIVVVIDEFPVLSSILSDSEEYKERFQALLTEGRHFGMYFFFAGQFFEKGLSGLKEGAKDQITWRAAMSGKYDEIRSTLDLPATSERDKTNMAELKQFHVLVKRGEADKLGDHLDMGKVLFFGAAKDGETTQMDWLGKNCDCFTASDFFNPDDVNVYQNKHPMFFDGLSYTSFAGEICLIEEDIKHRREHDYYDDFSDEENCFSKELYLYPGQPRTMERLFPIVLRNTINENMLVCGNPDQEDEVYALVLSLIQSSILQGCPVIIICPSGHKKLTHVLKANQLDTNERITLATSIESTVQELAKLDLQLQFHHKEQKLVILFDYAELISTFTALGLIQDQANPSSSRIDLKLEEHSRSDGGKVFGISVSNNGKTSTPEETENAIPDEGAKQDDELPKPEKTLDSIINYGTIYGIHPVYVYKTAKECAEYAGTDKKFTHRVFFKTPSEISDRFVTSRDSRYIEQMPKFTFRYSGSVHGMAYKPYFHNGLKINGKILQNGKVTQIKSDDNSQIE